MDMEQATVNAATGALGPVLQKLTALLVQEQYSSRLGAGACSDIEFIKSELASLHSLLLKIWEREDLGEECKMWMIDARELSYDMEDDIDHFMLGLEPSDGTRLGPRRSLKSILLRFKTRVLGVSRRCRDEWKTAPAQPSTSKRRSLDPRAGFLHRDVSKLVGMDEPKKQLLKLLQDHELVCIHGFAGMGKTTLADLVYREIGHEFECRAFVSLSKSPDMLEVLRAVLSQVTDGVLFSGSQSKKAATEENLRNDISNFLSDKRYVLIVDDIWDLQEWETISRALPEGVPRRRIVTTTRANAIAEKCRLTKFENGGACVYRHDGMHEWDAAALSRGVLDKKEAVSIVAKKKVRWFAASIFVEMFLPEMIAEMCCGMPLAVEYLSSAVASSLDYHDHDHEWHDIILKVAGSIHEDGPISGWYYDIKHNNVPLERRLWHVLLDGLLSSSNNHPSLKPLVESLHLGYDDLPLHLKTCLLYCSMYPTGYKKIERHGLVRKWMAEGFLYHQVAAAEGCLDELVSMGLLQPTESSEDNNKQYYSVHPIMRAFLVCKSKQSNFAGYHEDNSRPSVMDVDQIRRFSVGLLGRPDDIVSGRFAALCTRSLVVFSYPWPYTGGCLVPWELLENVRVLSIGSRGFPLSDIDLADICSRLLRLRYLGLKATAISALPMQIGKLQSLETLDISDTDVSELPKEIQELLHLETLYLSDTRVSELPREIGKLQHLETLNASNTSVRELPAEIGKLQNLKTLNVSHTRVRELPREEIGKLQRLESLDVSHTRVADLPREIGELRHLKTLNASNTSLRALPREMGKLWDLKTLNVSHTSVRELPLLLSDSVIAFAGNKCPDKALKLSADDLAIMRHLVHSRSRLSLARPRAGVDLTIMLYDHSYQLLPIAGIKIVGRHMRVPEWVQQHMATVSTLDIKLCKLEDDDLEFLCKKMPNLQHLTLTLEVLPKKAIVITGAGFSRLMSLYLDCRLPMVTFQQGSMPKLEHLGFKFYTSRALTSEDPVGIMYLLSLKRVAFQSSLRYKSDAPGISMVIDKVREEAKVHPNKIIISINGKDEEVIQVDATMTTSEENIVTSGGTGGSSGASNGSDGDKGSIIPVESYYSFGDIE